MPIIIPGIIRIIPATTSPSYTRTIVIVLVFVIVVVIIMIIIVVVAVIIVIMTMLCIPIFVISRILYCGLLFLIFLILRIF